MRVQLATYKTALATRVTFYFQLGVMIDENADNNRDGGDD